LGGGGIEGAFKLLLPLFPSYFFTGRQPQPHWVRGVVVLGSCLPLSAMVIFLLSDMLAFPRAQGKAYLKPSTSPPIH
jgi:hypothetical protein